MTLAVDFSRAAEFFGKRVEQDGDCWRWTGSSTRATPEKGGARYGRAQFYAGGELIQQWYAHRLSWEIHRSEIPDGLTIDHLCLNTLCVNPDHLEPVPTSVNNDRMQAGVRERRPNCRRCGRGEWHLNKHGHRYCAPCNRERTKRNKEKQR